MKTCEDFPIGSKWISDRSKGEYEVVAHNTDVGFQPILLLKCTKDPIKLSTYRIGDTFSQPPYAMAWAQPINTQGDFPVGSMWKSEKGVTYKVTKHLPNEKIRLECIEAGDTNISVGHKFGKSVNSMSWARCVDCGLTVEAHSNSSCGKSNTPRDKLSDFPIGSDYRSNTSGSTYRVVNHDGLYVKLQRLTSPNGAAIGGILLSLPNELSWAQPIHTEDLKKTLKGFPIGLRLKRLKPSIANLDDLYEIVGHENDGFLLLKYIKAGTGFKAYVVGDTFRHSPFRMSWLKPIHTEELMKTYKDFPIGSKWISRLTGGEYEVVGHRNVVGRSNNNRNLLLKCTKVPITFSPYSIGDTFQQSLNNMSWAQPIHTKELMSIKAKTLKDFPIGSKWVSSAKGEYEVVAHKSGKLLLRCTKVSNGLGLDRALGLDIYKVGSTFQETPSCMSWAKPFNHQQYNPTQEKNMNALVELAMAISDKEKTSDSISPMVKKALDKHREEREEAASDDIVQLLRDIEKYKIASRAKIKRLKAELKAQVGNLNDLDRRWAYAEETSNFIPVLAYFDQVNCNDLANPEDWDNLSKVPSDWKPSE